VYSYYYLIYYSLDQSPLWIDHVGYCKGPNPLLRIGHNIIVIGKKKKSAPEYIKEAPVNIIKVVITTQEKKSALPVKGHSHTCQSCINKEASASLRQLHSLVHFRDKFRSCSWRREREREREKEREMR
jgi:hypothetical protein